MRLLLLPPPSFRRRPESSGLENPCPLRGHDNKYALTVRPEASEKAKLYGIVALPLLDSGLRWNDEVAKTTPASRA